MVPVVDLSRRGALVASAFSSVAADVIASGTYLLGARTAAFERELAAWLDAPSAIAVSSGGSALQLALAGLGIGAGDEVIVPAFTAVPTASAVCAVGATPILVDVERGTANLDPGLVDASTSARTRAVIVVHLFGRPATLPTTALAVVEDAAQAQGAINDHGRSAATTYSFYPTKNLGGIGDGGAVVTTNPELEVIVRRLRVHGMTEMYVHESISQNFRMSEIEAAWLGSGLPRLAADNRRRRAIAAHYREVAGDLDWQLTHDDHVFHLCVFRSGERDETRRTLAEQDVSTAVHYPLALTEQPAYRQFATTPCPEAEAWARECITVPCFPEMTDAEVEHVGRALAKVCR